MAFLTNEHSNFAKRFDDILYEKKLTAAEVARRSGISEASLSKYRKGTYMPQGQNLLSIANALGVSVDYLLGEKKTTAASSGTNQIDVPVLPDSPVLDYELNIIEKLPGLSDDAKQLISVTVDALIGGNQNNLRILKAYFDALNRIQH